jgi:hypothetical protein
MEKKLLLSLNDFSSVEVSHGFGEWRFKSLFDDFKV